jgi:hypothetical protein
MQKSEDSPFARPVVLRHLRDARSDLLAILDRRKQATKADLDEVLMRAIGLLADLEKDFAASAEASAQKLEVSLTGIERMLNEALRSASDPESIAAHEREVKAQLRPYKAHMDQAAYALTFDNLLLKRLRDQFGIPRLSLFYL